MTIATSLYALVKIRMCCRLSVWNALNYFITTHLFLYHVPQWLGFCTAAAVLNHKVATLLLQKVHFGLRGKTPARNQPLCKNMPLEHSGSSNSWMLLCRSRLITLHEAATLFFRCDTTQEPILKWSFTLKVAGAQPWQRPAPTERRHDLYVDDAVTANTLLL